MSSELRFRVLTSNESSVRPDTTEPNLLLIDELLGRYLGDPLFDQATGDAADTIDVCKKPFTGPLRG